VRRLLGVLGALTLAMSAAAVQDAGASERQLRDADPHKYARYDEADLQRARRAVGAIRRADPRLEHLLDEAVGYAVFPEVGLRQGEGCVGVVYEEGQAAGRAILPASTAGRRPDGQPYAEIVIFGTRQALASFKQGGLSAGAQARAVAVIARTATRFRWVEGVSVFTLGREGGVTSAGGLGGVFEYLPYHRELTTGAR
jgi:hypothetical protein